MSTGKNSEAVIRDFVKENGGFTGSTIVASHLPITPIAESEGDEIKIQGRLGKLKVSRAKNKPYLVIYERPITDSSGTIFAVWFNSPWIEYIDSTREYVFLGKTNSMYGNKRIVNPVFTTPQDVEKWAKKLSNLLSS